MVKHRERLLAIFEWPGNHWRLLLLVALGLALLDVLLIYAPLLGAAALIDWRGGGPGDRYVRESAVRGETMKARVSL